MANLTESASFDATVYRIDQNDAVQGWNGSDIGIDNLQAQALANRTQWLKSRVDLGPRITGFDTFTPVSSSQVFNLTPATFLGKHVRANIASFDMELSLPITTAVADGGNMSLSAEPGTSAPFLLSQAKYVRITPQAGEKIYDAATNQLADEIFVFPYTVVRVHKLETGKWIVWKIAAKEDAPAGIISAWGVNTVPYGWLECNGAAISRAVYANLFANIGTTFGAGNGTTTFNVPDLRGEFIRGWDNGRGIDSGRAFGSAQSDLLKSHFHIMKKFNRSTGAGTGFFAMDDNGTDGSENTEATGGAETRPRNVALMFCIRF